MPSGLSSSRTPRSTSVLSRTLCRAGEAGASESSQARPLRLGPWHIRHLPLRIHNGIPRSWPECGQEWCPTASSQCTLPPIPFSLHLLHPRPALSDPHLSQAARMSFGAGTLFTIPRMRSLHSTGGGARQPWIRRAGVGAAGQQRAPRHYSCWSPSTRFGRLHIKK